MPRGIYERKPMSEETKRKISESNIGKVAWNKGQKLSQEHLKNRILAQSGENNGSWKGGISSDPKHRSWIKNKRNRMKRSCEGSHTYEEWIQLKERNDNQCVCCERKEPEIQLTQDHIIPVSKGGSDNIDNIQPLCRSCNSKKNNKIKNYLT